MSEYLVIRRENAAGRSESDWHWLALSADGDATDSGSGELSDALAVFQRFEQAPAVILLAPGHKVLLSDLTISREQQRHLKQVLPFLVEEKLIDDVEDVHIATGPHGADGSLPVAVVSHVELINWLDQLYTAGLPPSRVVPETLALPWESGRITVWLAPSQCLIRYGRRRAMACDAQNLSLALIDICRRQRSGDDEGQPVLIELLHGADPDSAHLAEQSLKRWRAIADEEGGRVPDFHIRRSEWALTESLGRQLVSELPSAFDLLQGGYTVNPQLGDKRAVNVRKIGLGIAACALVYLGLVLSAGLWFQSGAQSIRNDAVALYRDWFPQARRVFEPRRQLLSQMAGARDYGSARLIRYLDQLTLARNAESRDLALASLAFDAQTDTMRVDVNVPDIDTIEDLRQRLGAAGISSRLHQVSRSGVGVSGSLELEGEL